MLAPRLRSPVELRDRKPRRISMDNERARELLKAERARVEDLLSRSDPAVRADREAANEQGDWADPAVALTAEGVDQAVVDSLRERLAAIDRAERRLEEGTYGKSVRSGVPIPDERLEADPTAELTVEEAQRG
jgi:DnaK suppressor protein